MFLYGSILFLAFFLILTFFFTPSVPNYATEVTFTSEKVNFSQLKDQAEKEKEQKKTEELNEFYDQVTTTINETAAAFNGEVGIAYMDLTTGKRISLNGDKAFYTASTIKVPLAMLLADTISSNTNKWSDLVSYHPEKDYEEGTGIIVNDIQPNYSVRTLEEYAITYSDNIAKNMLYDYLGGDRQTKIAIYKRYLNKDTNPDDPQFTAEDAMTILNTLYTEKAANAEYQTIYNYMKQTVFHERMETDVTKGKVAHKIGSYANFTHDMGFLETPHPFALAVFTESPDGAAFISTLTDKLWQLQLTEYPDDK
jgi:beta-lactamase class A